MYIVVRYHGIFCGKPGDISTDRDTTGLFACRILLQGYHPLPQLLGASPQWADEGTRHDHSANESNTLFRTLIPISFPHMRSIPFHGQDDRPRDRTASQRFSLSPFETEKSSQIDIATFAQGLPGNTAFPRPSSCLAREIRSQKACASGSPHQNEINAVGVPMETTISRRSSPRHPRH